jgi:hypothetical protein
MATIRNRMAHRSITTPPSTQRRRPVARKHVILMSGYDAASASPDLTLLRYAEGSRVDGAPETTAGIS